MAELQLRARAFGSHAYKIMRAVPGEPVDPQANPAGNEALLPNFIFILLVGDLQVRLPEPLSRQPERQLSLLHIAHHRYDHGNIRFEMPVLCREDCSILRRDESRDSAFIQLKQLRLAQ